MEGPPVEGRAGAVHLEPEAGAAAAGGGEQLQLTVAAPVHGRAVARAAARQRRPPVQPRAEHAAAAAAAAVAGVLGRVVGRAAAELDRFGLGGCEAGGGAEEEEREEPHCGLMPMYYFVGRGLGCCGEIVDKYTEGAYM